MFSGKSAKGYCKIYIVEVEPCWFLFLYETRDEFQNIT